MTLHWLRTFRCHGSHHDTRSDTSQVGWRKWLDCHTPQIHRSIRRCLRRQGGDMHEKTQDVYEKSTLSQVSTAVPEWRQKSHIMKSIHKKKKKKRIKDLIWSFMAFKTINTLKEKCNYILIYTKAADR